METIVNIEKVIEETKDEYGPSVEMEERRQIRKRNGLIFAGLYLLCTSVSYIFYSHASDPLLNIAMVYTLGVLLVARYTLGYAHGMLFAFTSVISVNFFFTYPYGNLNFTLEGYQLTFAGMLIIAFITSAMTTNMKLQAAAIAEQEKQLMEAQKEKMRANLLRAVSHDIRTPLTGILGNSSTYLEMEASLSEEEKRKIIINIQDDTNWLLNMVENLLTVTRIDNETAKVNKYLEAVDEVVSSSVVRFKKRFPDAAVKVIIPDDVVMIYMDVMLIEQVIINILQNAQMHSNTKRPLELIVKEMEKSVLFRIKDYGDGIDPNKMNTLFDGESFRTSHSGRTDSYKGMGIGLSICKTIIMAHDGRIGAKNHLEGAEFFFELPKEVEE